MVGDETDNARAVSSRRVLTSLSSATFEDFAARVWDTRLSEVDEMMPALLNEFDAMPAAADRQALAVVIERLRNWNRTADTASVETTWFILSNERRIMAQRTGAQHAHPRVEGLREALRLLQEEWNTTEVPWGWLNRHQRPLPGMTVALDGARTSLPAGGASGGLGSVFSYESAPFGSPRPRIGRGGNSFVKVISFGPAVRAASILNYGQSGDPASSHFFDQAALYVRREFKPAWFTRADVEANAVRSYTVR
jgi:acyl-homoserine-lactone acylase